MALVVDDEVPNLDTFRRVFRNHFELHIIERSPEAAALLANKRFDLGFFDYAMPDLDGIELCRRAASAQPSMVRLLLTAHADLEIVRQSEVLGTCHAVIAKPWDKATVLDVVNRVLRLAAVRQTVDSMSAAVAQLDEHKRK